MKTYLIYFNLFVTVPDTDENDRASLIDGNNDEGDDDDSNDDEEGIKMLLIFFCFFCVIWFLV